MAGTGDPFFGEEKNDEKSVQRSTDRSALFGSFGSLFNVLAIALLLPLLLHLLYLTNHSQRVPAMTFSSGSSLLTLTCSALMLGSRLSPVPHLASRLALTLLSLSTSAKPDQIIRLSSPSSFSVVWTRRV